MGCGHVWCLRVPAICLVCLCGLSVQDCYTDNVEEFRPVVHASVRRSKFMAICSRSTAGLMALWVQFLSVSVAPVWPLRGSDPLYQFFFHSHTTYCNI